MSRKTPPTVHRRIIAAQLRQLRGDRNRPEIEEACDLGENALYRYETCETGMPPAIARRVFSYLGVQGAALEELVSIAKLSRKRASGITLHSVPSWLEQLLVLEQEASGILEFAMITVVPGLLQTERYARAVVGAGGHDATDEYVAARLDRQTLLDGDVKLWIVLHEAALRREVGGAEVMCEQVKHLIDVARRPNVNIRIIPNSHGEHRAMTASFKILEFPLASNYKIAYEETVLNAHYIDDPDAVGEYERAYRDGASAALTPDRSIELLEQIAKDYGHDQS